MKLPQLIAAMVVALSSQSSLAQEKTAIPQALTQLEARQKIDQIEGAMDKLNNLQILANGMTRKKYSECLMAFENEKFCSCLRDNLPVPVNFSMYIKTVITPKEGLVYSKADNEIKQLIETTLKVREVCVAAGR